jgi:hypothetical protein
MTRFKNLLISGCSFTSNGLGGLPPTKQSAGGCSYIEDPSYTVAPPGSWPGFLAQQMKITSLCNTAASSHGNILVANAILECIQRFQYLPSDTLIIFNISEPSRLDLMCAHDHPEADLENVHWGPELIPYTFVKRSSDLIKNLQKQLGFEYVERMTTNQIEFLFNFLDNKGFEFYFLTMTDYKTSCLQNTLDKFESHFISLDPGSTMLDFCKLTNNQISSEDIHPTENGHRLIAQQIYRRIQNDLQLSVL